MHTSTGKVALKRLRHRGPNQRYAECLTLFLQETAIWMELRHENILQCFGTFIHMGDMYSVSPFMKNGTLSDWIQYENPIGQERLRLITELAGALVYLHAHGVIHGDVKADNVLISDDLHVQLCDFGLAKHAKSETTPALKGSGTYRWQSPELLDGQSKTFKSDVYAFSMTAVEVLTGEIPFPEIHSVVAFVKTVCLRGVRPTRTSSPLSLQAAAYSRAWDVAELCWHEDPDQRICMRDAAVVLKEPLPAG